MLGFERRHLSAKIERRIDLSSSVMAPAHYSAFSRTVHWLTVLLMAGMFYTGFVGFGGGPPPGARGGPGGGPPGAMMAMRPMSGAPAGAPGGTMAMRPTPNMAPGGTMAMRPMNMAPGAGGPQAGGPPGGGGPPETPFGLIPLHKAMGFTILLLAFARITFRLFSRNRFPELPVTMPTWQIWAARGIQGLIYIGILLQPLTGWLGSGRAFTYFGIFTMPAVTILSRSFGPELRFMHTNGAWVLIWLISLHTLGALFHHFVRKDNVLLSMIRGS